MLVDLELSEDERVLSEVFGTFVARECPISVVRRAAPFGFDPPLWKLLREMGAPGMGVDGASLSELAVVTEHLGRVIAPVPLVEHLVASRALAARGVEQPDEATIMTVALRPAADGVWTLVPAGAVADVVIGVDGDELVAVTDPAPGHSPRNHADAPLADRSSRGGNRTVLGPAAEFDAIRADWQILTASALVGLAAAALELGVEYVKGREQFGVPVGTFQAVQHGLAELPGPIDGARLLVHRAATADGTNVDVLDLDITDRNVLASMAFLFASDVAARTTDRSLHFHGGYGVSEEYHIQLYYRRARGWALVHGDPEDEALRLGELMFGGE